MKSNLLNRIVQQSMNLKKKAKWIQTQRHLEMKRKLIQIRIKLFKYFLV